MAWVVKRIDEKLIIFCLSVYNTVAEKCCYATSMFELFSNIHWKYWNDVIEFECNLLLINLLYYVHYLSDWFKSIWKTERHSKKLIWTVMRMKRRFVAIGFINLYLPVANVCIKSWEICRRAREANGFSLLWYDVVTFKNGVWFFFNWHWIKLFHLFLAQTKFAKLFIASACSMID